MSQSLPALQCSTVCSGQAVAGLHASCQRHCSSRQQGSAAHPAQLTAAHRHGWQHCRRHTEAHNPLSVLLSVSQQLRHTQRFTAYCSKAPLKAARSPAHASCHCLFQHRNPSAFPLCLFFKPEQQENDNQSVCPVRAHLQTQQYTAPYVGPSGNCSS